VIEGVTAGEYMPSTPSLLERGDAVAVYLSWGCGRCKRCLLSAENACERLAELGSRGGGLGRDGGMAEFLLVPDSSARAARRLRPG
jgi:threonine dehydrogenase-like Zn-dependent dehydrogenase